MLTDQEKIVKKISSAIQELIREEADYEFQRGVQRGRFDERQSQQQRIAELENRIAWLYINT